MESSRCRHVRVNLLKRWRNTYVSRSSVAANSGGEGGGAWKSRMGSGRKGGQLSHPATSGSEGGYDERLYKYIQWDHITNHEGHSRCRTPGPLVSPSLRRRRGRNGALQA